jgi:hypothetical protein
MLRKSLLGLTLIAAFGAAQADTLLIEGIQAAAPTASERPRSGQSKEQVEQRFGQPTARHAAVGEPPISSWEYPEFVVYFEYDHVIHAVPKRETEDG